MLIPPRKGNLSNLARRDEKKQIVVDWVLNYQISSLEILSARLGVEPNATNRFFAKLIDEKILERIKNTRWDKRDLVILGPAAAGFIDPESSDLTADLMKARGLRNKKYLAHDVEAQKVALLYLPLAVEIVSENNFANPALIKKPDMVVFDEDGDSIAIEYESTKKSPATTYYIFHQYRKMLEDKLFIKVDFYFDDVKTLNLYKNAFGKEFWPEVSFDKKKRTSKRGKDMVRVLMNDPVRAQITFNLINLKKPYIYTLEEACKPKKYFDRPFGERMEVLSIDMMNQKAKAAAARVEEKERQEELEQQAREQRWRESRQNLNQEIKNTLAAIDESEKADGTWGAAMGDMFGKYQSKTPELKEKLQKLLDQALAS